MLINNESLGELLLHAGVKGMKWDKDKLSKKEEQDAKDNARSFDARKKQERSLPSIMTTDVERAKQAQMSKLYAKQVRDAGVRKTLEKGALQIRNREAQNAATKKASEIKKVDAPSSKEQPREKVARNKDAGQVSASKAGQSKSNEVNRKLKLGQLMKKLEDGTYQPTKGSPLAQKQEADRREKVKADLRAKDAARKDKTYNQPATKSISNTYSPTARARAKVINKALKVRDVQGKKDNTEQARSRIVNEALKVRDAQGKEDVATKAKKEKKITNVISKAWSKTTNSLKKIKIKTNKSSTEYRYQP